MNLIRSRYYTIYIYLKIEQLRIRGLGPSGLRVSKNISGEDIFASTESGDESVAPILWATLEWRLSVDFLDFFL